MSDPRLDRLEEFDERSRSYAARDLLGTAQPRSYTWPCDTVLDQGREGACVGFSIAHELRAAPVKVAGIDDAFAQRLYKRAQVLDQWPGEDYSGTSVLAGMKAVQELGHISEYRWCFGVDDLALAVSRMGPAVLGVAWHESMYRPTVRGGRAWITRSGPVVGGHAIMCRGFNVKARAFALHNSWGRDWGRDGVAWISWDDMTALLADRGEAVIPVVR
jgi:hypothetical protein